MVSLRTIFVFEQKTAYEMRISDWSSDVCSSDLIAEAASLGYRIRLVGVAEANGTGLFQRVHPHLVPLDHPLAHVAGSLNAVVAEGNFVGRLFFEGAGAGDGPTASAVVADLIDIRSEEHTSELQSLMRISYAVFCLK